MTANSAASDADLMAQKSAAALAQIHEVFHAGLRRICDAQGIDYGLVLPLIDIYTRRTEIVGPLSPDEPGWAVYHLAADAREHGAVALAELLAPIDQVATGSAST